MAATTTTVNGAIGASDKTITLTAYTAPSGRAKPLVKIDDEIMLITDVSNAPTLGVVRGYLGTSAVAHSTQAGAVYGAPTDMQVAKGPTHVSASLTTPTVFQYVQEVTATGSTGSTAAIVTVPPCAFLNATGTSGAGINLPVPVAGHSYMVKNNGTGVIKLYSVGATINGTTGTTAFSLTATGNLMAFANCSTAGAWQVAGNT